MEFVAVTALLWTTGTRPNAHWRKTALPPKNRLWLRREKRRKKREEGWLHSVPVVKCQGWSLVWFHPFTCFFRFSFCNELIYASDGMKKEQVGSKRLPVWKRSSKSMLQLKHYLQAESWKTLWWSWWWENTKKKLRAELKAKSPRQQMRSMIGHKPWKRSRSYHVHHTGTININVCVCMRLLNLDFLKSLHHQSITTAGRPQTPHRRSLNDPASLFWTRHTNPLATSISRSNAELPDWDTLVCITRTECEGTHISFSAYID